MVARMGWQVFRRSLLSVVMFVALMALFILLAAAVPAIGPIIGIFGAVSMFGAVILLLGWIFQEPTPTRPPDSPGRRLKQVPDLDDRVRPLRPMTLPDAGS